MAEHRTVAPSTSVQSRHISPFYIGVSSNGRTSDFGSDYESSTLSTPSIY